jgi:hypothetical protein
MNQPDFDIKTLDLAQYFAAFGRRAMPERALWLLSLASSVLPEGHIGAEIWLSRVAGGNLHDRMMREWARGLATTLGTVKPKMGKRHRLLFATYCDSWGHAAAEDGLGYVIIGKVPPVRERVRQLNVHHERYTRMRDLIAGFAMMQAEQYEDALRWAVRACRMSEIDIDTVTPHTLETAC